MMDSLMQQQESFATLSVWGTCQLGTYVFENVINAVYIGFTEVFAFTVLHSTFSNDSWPKGLKALTNLDHSHIRCTKCRSGAEHE